MQLSYLIFYVPDVSRSMDFYERAFGLSRRFLHESGEYGEMETGATALAFASTEMAASNLSQDVLRHDLNGPSQAVEIGLTTSDVPSAYARALDSGAASVSEPKEKPWGQTVAYVRDLDGILVEICTPMN